MQFRTIPKPGGHTARSKSLSENIGSWWPSYTAGIGLRSGCWEPSFEVEL